MGVVCTDVGVVCTDVGVVLFGNRGPGSIEVVANVEVGGAVMPNMGWESNWSFDWSLSSVVSCAFSVGGVAMPEGGPEGTVDVGTQKNIIMVLSLTEPLAINRNLTTFITGGS